MGGEYGDVCYRGSVNSPRVMWWESIHGGYFSGLTTAYTECYHVVFSANIQANRTAGREING
jgi:hypothetical protein